MKKYRLDKDINQSWNDQQKDEFLNLISDCTSNECAAGVTLEEPRDVLPSFDFGKFTNFLSTGNPDSATGLDRFSYRHISSLSEDNKLAFFRITCNVWERDFFWIFEQRGVRILQK